ncbi:MAG: hypothetical protein R3F61_14370 [Myxococcota bacterium]
MPDEPKKLLGPPAGPPPAEDIEPYLGPPGNPKGSFYDGGMQGLHQTPARPTAWRFLPVVLGVVVVLATLATLLLFSGVGGP